MRRFERICDAVEPVEEYRRGGYRPVHLHDIFNQRYEVIGKLAFGQFSTVWLATDQLHQRQVALKILKADASKNNTELDILLHLSQGLDHPVFPVMISDGQGMTVTAKPHQANDIKRISKQILLGVDFLHKLGITHCDLQPANILFAFPTNDELPLEEPEFSPVTWLEGVVPDDSAPEYLMPSQRRRGELDDVDFSMITVKIGDLGGATRTRDNRPVTPRALRAPELIHRNTWDSNIDTWTLGCLIFELATDEPLFPLGCFGLTPDEIDNEHMRLIDAILDNDGENLAKYTTERLPDFGEDARQLVSFLSCMLQKDPARRGSTAELLNHSFVLHE